MDPVVLAAIVTGGFGLVGFYVKAKVERTIGRPNGQGNVVQMSVRILEEVGALQGAVGRLHGRLDEHTAQDARNFDDLREEIRQASGR